MFIRRFHNHLTAFLLMALLSLNTVVAGGLSTCHCSSARKEVSNNSCSCCQTSAKEQAATKKEHSTSCCSKKPHNKNKNSRHSELESQLSLCNCGCQYQAPESPLKEISSRLKLSQAADSIVTTTIHSSSQGNNAHTVSSKQTPVTNCSVQVLCCSWLT